MWIFSTYGFFSIVKKPDHRTGAIAFHVRARRRQDLENLIGARAAYRSSDAIGLEDIVDTPEGDYCSRLILTAYAWGTFAEVLFSSVDYANFKTEIAATPDQVDKLGLLNRIWSIMADYQEELGHPPFGRPSRSWSDDLTFTAEDADV